MKKQLKRYHRDVYYPTWADKSTDEFLALLDKKDSLVFTIHSVEKIVGYSQEYGRQLLKYLLKSVRKSTFEKTSIFEYYARDEFITKACLRFSFPAFPVDLILVISADGTVITVFTANKHDNHDSLNTALYEKG